MNLCNCGGDYLRHGILRYKSGAVSYRYICRDCRKTMIAPITEDVVKGKLYFNPTGRPTLKDWRFEVAA
jgi:uncharacterized protein YlaI